MSGLVEKKEELIERWASDLRKVEQLKRFNLTRAQRRVIASLKWWREVAKSNAHMDWQQQPPPVMGYDERNRIVVQKMENGKLVCWALTRQGEPADVSGKVRSVKDNHIVQSEQF